jgi:two-component system sensor histidine kinase DesK
MHRSAVDEEKAFVPPYLLWLIWVFWLFFLIQPVPALLAPPLSPLAVAELCGIVLFTVVYLWTTWQVAYLLARPMPVSIRPDRSWWIAVSILFGLAIFLVIASKGSATGAFIYVAACIGGRVNAWQAAASSAGLTLLALLLGTISGSTLAAIADVIFIIPAVGFLVYFFSQAIQVNQELRLARREIARLAVSEERLRFARDLLDLLGHSLSLITLKSELAGQLIAENPERAEREVREVEAAARKALLDVRAAVAGYRQATLRSELEHAHELLAAAGIECIVRDEAGELAPNVETLLGWVLRESITNVMRHSRARHCVVALTRSEGVARMTLTDDGRGLAPTWAESGPTLSEHGNGLRGISERVTAGGGHCEFGAADEQGFRLSVTVPLQQPSDVQPTLPPASSMEGIAS